MRFSELDGKAVAVWGVGRETRSFAAHLAQRLPGARLVAVVGDDPERDRAAAAQDANLAEIPFLTGEQAPTELTGIDVLVRSPGVSIHKPPLEQLRAQGVRITTATGLWLHEREGRNVIAITGTKGKGTTAVLIAHLSATQRTTHLAGNIGRPVLDLLDAPATELVVLELSSFQVSDLEHGAQTAVLTNLFKEHIDWHGSEAAYRREKLRLLHLEGIEGCAYRPGDPEVQSAIAPGIRLVQYGTPAGWHVTDGGVAHGEELLVPSGALPLPGAHNAENLCAALAGLEAAGLGHPPLPGALEGVKGLPHRLETVLETGGVQWVDDSIATNPAATLVALAAFDGHDITLIAGGYERGQDYEELARALGRALRVTLICLPDTGARLADGAREHGLEGERILHASDMVQAVGIAREHARTGSIVLLSPAAASYNLYDNFEQRGEHFATLAAAGPEPSGP